MFNLRSFGSLSLMTLLGSSLGFAQSPSGQGQRANDVQLNTITTAVPFLMIGPDARAGGMGDVGAATEPDEASIHWNPAKMTFIDNKFGFSLTYTPWLRALVPDINLAYLSGYGKIGKKGQQTLSGSLRFFSLGNIAFTDEQGNSMGQFTPSEFALDISYARKLSREFSGGISLRYIYSNLTGGINVGGADTKAAQTAAADISFYYRTDRIKVGDMKSVLSAGINISNIGGKVSYTQTNEEDFIPINMRLGVGYKIMPTDKYSAGLYFDVNKLMVPTPPQYGQNKYLDPTLPQGTGPGQLGHESNQDPTYQQIVAGKDPNRSVPNGMFTSFGDAPGGSREELSEVNFAVGAEFWYLKYFAVRLGYFHEAPSKGNRQYVTVGFSGGFSVVRLDFAYLIPTQQRHPLEKTLRIGINISFPESFEWSKNKNNDALQD